MLSYEDIILLGEERVLVIQEHQEGRCWCGQQWDGEKMVQQPLARPTAPDAEPAQAGPEAPGR